MRQRKVLDKWTATKTVRVKKQSKKVSTAGHLLLFKNNGFITDAVDQDTYEAVEETAYIVRLERPDSEGGNYTREVTKETWEGAKVGDSVNIIERE